MKIKDIADRLNISPRAIRFYEEKGLLAPGKQEHNRYRTFNEKHIWRLQTIISLREAGMSIDEIRKALAELDGDGREELLYYLELQRSVLFAKWVEMKQMIETADDMINMLKTEQTLPIDDIYRLAERSRKLREQRSNWHDHWNFDQLAPIHDQEVSANGLKYKDYGQALDWIVKWAAPIPGEKGLDIGAGTGNLAGMLLAKGTEMTAVDQSKQMLRLCQSKFPNMETKLGNFLALPFLDGNFDFAVSSFAFHHLTDTQKQLAIVEMRRVLKPHGRICIADYMYPNERMKPQDEHRSGQTPDYPLLTDLIGWLEQRDYFTKHHQINELLHVVCAIPIRS